MTISDEITREVAFTDHNCREDAQMRVTVSIHHDRPTSTISISDTMVIDEIKEPDLLRSYAACLNAAADEMERLTT